MRFLQFTCLALRCRSIDRCESLFPAGRQRRFKHLLTVVLAISLCTVFSVIQIGSALESVSAEDSTESPESPRYISSSLFVPLNWFPLVDGARYTYRGVFGDQVSVGSSIARRYQLGDGDVFIFTREDKIGEPVEVLGSDLFHWGYVFTDARGVWAGPWTWKYELDKESRSNLRLVVARPLNPGGSFQISSDSSVRTFFVEEGEDVTVPAGRFEDCLKLRVHTQWSTSEDVSHAWFARGVGLVKWIRSTGRVDELVEYEFPEELQ